MPKVNLTYSFIDSLGKPDKRTLYYDKGETGLFLKLTKAGSKIFNYRYRSHGKSRQYRVGKYPGVSLADARKKIRKLKVQIDEGRDPVAERKAKKNKTRPKTFEDLVDEFKNKYMPRKLKKSTQKTYTQRIDGEMLPAFKGMYVKDISRGVIIELLETIAFERDSPYQSNRVRAILSSMFSYAVQREIAEYNPVKTVKPLGDEDTRERVLNEDEIRKFWECTHTLQKPVGQLLRILLLLGQRLGEARRLKWDDIKNDIWTIAKSQTKNKQIHEVPLPSSAVAIIENLKNDSDYVFKSKYGGPIKNIYNSFNRLKKDTGIKDFRIHDLRRTIRSNMPAISVDETVAERILNHKASGTVSRIQSVYNRYDYMDEKLTALNRWQHKLEQIIEGKEAKITKLG